MKKRLYFILFTMAFVLTIILSTSQNSLAATSEGDGTAANPYLIKTIYDLYKITEEPKAYYKLVNDLDFQNLRRQPMAEFMGVLDGDGHTIRNLWLVSEDKFVGLFSRTTKATIKNLKICDSKFNASYGYIGFIVGQAEATTLQNVHLDTVSITGGYGVGGIIGYAGSSNFINCSVKNSQISGEDQIGGVFAFCFDSTVTNCYSINNNIKGSGSIGGLVGIAQIGVSFTRCYSSSTVEGTSNVGGLAGTFIGGAALGQCFSIGNVTGTTNVGGLVGVNDNSSTTIENSFSMCEIESTDSSAYVGGLIGNINRISPTIKNSYFAGTLTGRNKFGLSSLGTVIYSYFDETKTGILTPISQARTKEELYMPANYEGWDFENIWIIDEGRDYPRLRFTP